MFWCLYHSLLGLKEQLDVWFFFLCHWKVLRAQSYLQLVLYELKQAGNTHFVVFLYLRKRWQWKVCNFCPHEEQFVIKKRVSLWTSALIWHLYSQTFGFLYLRIVQTLTRTSKRVQNQFLCFCMNADCTTWWRTGNQTGDSICTLNAVWELTGEPLDLVRSSELSWGLKGTERNWKIRSEHFTFISNMSSGLTMTTQQHVLCN